MSDQEIIAQWMEPKPPVADQEEAETMDLCGSGLRSPLGFWRCVGGYDEAYIWRPRTLTLDALWQVEDRLIASISHLQYCYEVALSGQLDADTPTWHLRAEQKTTALAAVLRPIVEVAR